MKNGILVVWLLALAISGCGGSAGDESGPIAGPDPDPVTPPVNNALDDQLRTLIAAEGLTGDPSTGRDLPSINDPIAQLGMKLFFSKSLGGEFDSACVSCHHPVLGGADNMSLSHGVGAIDPDMLGIGRVGRATILGGIS